MTTCDQLEQLIAELPSLQSAVISTMATVPAVSAPSSTSACLAKATTPESPAQTGGHQLTSPLPSLLRPLSLKRDQTSVRLPLNSEHTPQPTNCHPVATQRLHHLEQEQVTTHLPVGTQQLPLSRHEQVITSAHLPQHLQQFITAHKSTLHPAHP